MTPEMVLKMDVEEVRALADAFQIDWTEMTHRELCHAVSFEMNRD
jgi:hypothetical protein